MKYRSDIDGLRALAIIPVILYHAGIKLFSGGYVGVDVFFVISGYLITLIITEEIKQERFTIKDFYERRIRRIFPALFVVILFCLIAGTIFILPSDFKNFGKSIIATTLFVANIFFWKKTDYFAEAAETKPLLHTWSLSVEEQFYLIFPIILLFIHRYYQGRWKIFLLPAAALSLVLSICGVYYYPSATFFLIPARAWELLLGSFLALGLFPQIHNQRLKDIASIAGLMLIALAVFQFSEITPFPGAYALFPCFGAALIIYAGKDGTSIVGRIIGHRSIVFIGLISYSLYLWHWPLIVFAKQIFYDEHNDLITASILILSFIMAVLSWKYIEHPFRKKGTLKQRKRLFVTATIVMLISVVSGYTTRARDGWSDRFGDNLISFDFDRSKYNLNTCFLNDNQHYDEWKGESCFLQTGKTSNTLLWGDSFAAHYVPGIEENNGLINSNILQYTAGGCAPAFNYDPKFQRQCKSFSANIYDIISNYKIEVVVMSADWDLALKYGLSYEGIKSTIDLLRKEGVKVVVIGQSPRFNHSVQYISNKHRIQGRDVFESSISLDLDTINSKLREITGSNSFIDPSEFFCTMQKCRFKSAEDFYFWDDGHFTTYGSSQISNYIFSKIKI